MAKKAIGLCFLFLGTMVTLYGLVILLFSGFIYVTYLIIGIVLVIVGGVLTSSGAASEAKKQEKKRKEYLQQKERELSDALT